MKVPAHFANSRTWYMVEVSHFCHDDVHFKEGYAAVRVFHNYEFAKTRLDEIERLYGKFNLKMFRCQPPLFNGEPTEKELRENIIWEYLTETGWITITHQDNLGSLNDRLWDIICSEQFRVAESSELKN